MDWQVEANAVMKDIEPFVFSVKISHQHEPSDLRIHLDLVTLERQKFTVIMDSNGFRAIPLKDTRSEIQIVSSQEQPAQGDSNDGDVRVYETINALLDDNSPQYREAYAQAIIDKINLIKQ